jgi:hypothetical protein
MEKHEPVPGSLAYAIRHSCIRYLWERDLATGKMNPACVGCLAMDRDEPCPLGPMPMERNPFASLLITKDEAIRRLEEWRAKQNQYVDEKIREIRNG